MGVTMMEQDSPEHLLLKEFIDDDNWRALPEHTPQEIAREVAGLAFDAMFGHPKSGPEYSITADQVGRVAGLIAYYEQVVEFEETAAEAARLFAERVPLRQVS